MSLRPSPNVRTEVEVASRDQSRLKCVLEVGYAVKSQQEKQHITGLSNVLQMPGTHGLVHEYNRPSLQSFPVPVKKLGFPFEAPTSDQPTAGGDILCDNTTLRALVEYLERSTALKKRIDEKLKEKTSERLKLAEGEENPINLSVEGSTVKATLKVGLRVPQTGLWNAVMNSDVSALNNGVYLTLEVNAKINILAFKPEDTSLHITIALDEPKENSKNLGLLNRFLKAAGTAYNTWKDGLFKEGSYWPSAVIEIEVPIM